MRARSLTLVLPQAGLPIHLVRAHVDEAANGPAHAAGLQHHMRTVRVVHREGKTVAE